MDEQFKCNAETLQRFSCLAIRAAAQLSDTAPDGALAYFHEIMHPGCGGYAWLQIAGMPEEENQSLRVLALLFAAEMAKDEGL